MIYKSQIRIENAPALTLHESRMESIKHLFDNEYYESFGPYDRFQPYGYAPSENRVLGIVDGEVIGHVGWSCRLISVGEVEVGVGGVGGVLISPAWRGQGVAKMLLSACVESMRSENNLDFGYLGCRKEIVDFYKTCGWQSMFSSEIYIDHSGKTRMAGMGEPLLIYGVSKSVDEWPKGIINIRGRAW